LDRTPQSSQHRKNFAMLNWFNTRISDEFALSLARDLIAQIPLATLTEPKRGTSSKQAKALQALHVRVDKFKRDNPLNIYKKAKLGNILKWELKAAGYPETFIDQITDDIILRLTIDARL
jgi:hypothetical protein